jgi:hypothetical protein
VFVACSSRVRCGFVAVSLPACHPECVAPDPDGLNRVARRITRS